MSRIKAAYESQQPREKENQEVMKVKGTIKLNGYNIPDEQEIRLCYQSIIKTNS